MSSQVFLMASTTRSTSSLHVEAAEKGSALSYPPLLLDSCRRAGSIGNTLNAAKVVSRDSVAVDAFDNILDNELRLRGIALNWLRLGDLLVEVKTLADLGEVGGENEALRLFRTE